MGVRDHSRQRSAAVVVGVALNATFGASLAGDTSPSLDSLVRACTSQTPNESSALPHQEAARSTMLVHSAPARAPATWHVIH